MRTTRLLEADRRGGLGHGLGRGAPSAGRLCTPATRRTTRTRSSARANIATSATTTGASCPARSTGSRRTAWRSTRRASSTSSIGPAARSRNRRTQAQDTIVVFDPAGKFVRSFGKEYHGGGHGIDIREENGQEFLYLSCMFPVNLVVKTDLKGEVVWIKEAPQGAARLRQAQHARSRRPTWLSPPTAASTSATATARTTSTSTTRTPSGCGPSAALATAPASSRHRTASGWTTAPAASRSSSSPTAPTPGSST